MDNFLERHKFDLRRNKLPKPYIYRKNKSEFVVKSFPQRKIPGPEGFNGAFYQIFMKEIIPTLHKLFQKVEEEEILLTSFYESSIVLIPKPEKDIKRKLLTNIHHESR